MILRQIFDGLRGPAVFFRKRHGLRGVKGLVIRLQLHRQRIRTQTVLIAVVDPLLLHTGGYLLRRVGVRDGVGAVGVLDDCLGVLRHRGLIDRVDDLGRDSDAIGTNRNLVLRQVGEAPGPVAALGGGGGGLLLVVGVEDDRHTVGTDLVLVIGVGPFLLAADFHKLQRVRHGDLIGTGDLLRAGDFQSEHAVRHFGDLRIRICIGSRRCTGDVEALRSLDFLDVVFLPPVQSADMDLAFLIRDQLGYRSCGIERVDTVLSRELQQAAVILVIAVGRIGRFVAKRGVFKGSIDGELHAGKRLRVCIAGLLGDLQIAGEHHADVLGLVNGCGVRDKEGIGAVVLSGALEVVVQEVGHRLEGIGSDLLGIIRFVVGVTQLRDLDDREQIRAKGRADHGVEDVIVGIIAPQCQGIQSLRRSAVQTRSIPDGRSAEVIKAEVLDGFAAIELVQTAGVVDLGALAVRTLVGNREACGVLQLLNDRVVVVIGTAIGSALHAVLILVDPQVALDLNRLIHQGHSHRVGRQKRRDSVKREGGEVHVVGVGERVIRVEGRIIRHIDHISQIRQDHTGVPEQLDAGIHDDNEGRDLASGFSVLIGGRRVFVGRFPAVVLGEQRSVIQGLLHRGRRAGDRTLVVVDGVFVRIHVHRVVHHEEHAVHDVLPDRAAAVAGLGNHITESDVVDRLLLGVTVVERESPPDPAALEVRTGRVRVVAVGTARVTDARIVEARVSVAIDRLHRLDRGQVGDVLLRAGADPDILAVDREAFIEVFVLLHGVFTSFSIRPIRFRGAANVRRGFQRQSELAGVVREGTAEGIAVRVVALRVGGEIRVVLQNASEQSGRGTNRGLIADRHFLAGSQALFGGIFLVGEIEDHGAVSFADLLITTADARAADHDGLLEIKARGVDDGSALGHIGCGSGQDIQNDGIDEVALGSLRVLHGDRVGHFHRIRGTEGDRRWPCILGDENLRDIDGADIDRGRRGWILLHSRRTGTGGIPLLVLEVDGSIVGEPVDGYYAMAGDTVRLLFGRDVDRGGLHAELFAEAVGLVKDALRLADNFAAGVADGELGRTGGNAGDRVAAAVVCHSRRAELAVIRTQEGDRRRDGRRGRQTQDGGIMRRFADHDLGVNIVDVGDRGSGRDAVFFHDELRQHLVFAGHGGRELEDQLAVAGEQGVNLAALDVVVGGARRRFDHRLPAARA